MASSKGRVCVHNPDSGAREGRPAKRPNTQVHRPLGAGLCVDWGTLKSAGLEVDTMASTPQTAAAATPKVKRQARARRVF